MQPSNGDDPVAYSSPSLASFPFPAPLPPPPPPRLRPWGGLSPPFHPLQVSSWVLMVFCVVIYFSLCIPFVPDGHEGAKWSFVSLYLLVFCLGFAAFLAVSLSDPFVPVEREGGDKVAQQSPAVQRSQTTSASPSPPPPAASSSSPPVTANGAAAEAPFYGGGDSREANGGGGSAPVPSAVVAAPPPSPLPSPASQPLPRCPVCRAVQGSDTKHCYLDGRCVDGFDHHCVYLNTCVGRRNYPLFFTFVSSVSALLTLQLFVTLWLLAHVNDEEYGHKADEVSHTVVAPEQYDSPVAVHCPPSHRPALVCVGLCGCSVSLRCRRRSRGCCC